MTLGTAESELCRDTTQRFFGAQEVRDRWLLLEIIREHEERALEALANEVAAAAELPRVVRSGYLGAYSQPRIVPGMPPELSMALMAMRFYAAMSEAFAPRAEEGRLIRKTPGVLGGDARIRDTRIAVWMLVRARQLGMTDEEIRNRYRPPLSRPDLDAAWRYYAVNKDEIDLAISENEAD